MERTYLPAILRCGVLERGSEVGMEAPDVCVKEG
jgi:hypothetical protein